VSKRLEEIAQRKRALIERAGYERTELATAYQKIRSPIQFSSTLLALGRSLKSHPLVAMGLSSFLVSGYAGKLLGSASKLLGLWRVTRPVWSWWSKQRKSR